MTEIIVRCFLPAVAVTAVLTIHASYLPPKRRTVLTLAQQNAAINLNAQSLTGRVRRLAGRLQQLVGARQRRARGPAMTKKRTSNCVR